MNKIQHKNIIYPIKAGVIADFGTFEQLLRELIKKLNTGKNKKLFMPSIVACCLVPESASEVDIRAFRDSLEHTGSRDIYIIYSTFATALGTGIDFNKTNLFVDAGSGKISVTVLSKEWIKATTKLDFGLNKLTDIVAYTIKNKYNITCNSTTTSGLILKNLSMSGSPKTDKLKIEGIDNKGYTTNLNINLSEINTAILPYLEIIKTEVRMVIDKFKQDFKEPIESIIVTGAMSNISGFDSHLNFGYPVMIKSEEDYTLKGLTMLDKDFEKNKKAMK